jgi:hypothetical protein
MEAKQKAIKSNVELYLESVNNSYSIEKMAEKYNFNTSVMSAIISHGREEHRSTNYWNMFLKNTVNRYNTIN